MAAPGDLALRLQLASQYDAKGAPELAIEHYRLSRTIPNADPALALRSFLVAPSNDGGSKPASRSNRVPGTATPPRSEPTDPNQVSLLSLPWRIDGSRPPIAHRPPRLGEHTAEFISRFGRE